MRHIADCIHRGAPIRTLLRGALPYDGTAAGVLTVTGILLLLLLLLYRSRDPRQLGPRPERRGWGRTGS